MSDFDPRLHPDGAPGVAVAAMRAQWGDVEFEHYCQRIGEQHQASIRQSDAVSAFHRARASWYAGLAILAVTLAVVGAFVAVVWAVR